MKYIIIVLIIAVVLLGYKVFTPELEFYPKGTMGNMTPYYTNLSMAKCDICGRETSIYKVDSKNRTWCNDCYRNR